MSDKSSNNNNNNNNNNNENSIPPSEDMNRSTPSASPAAGKPSNAFSAWWADQQTKSEYMRLQATAHPGRIVQPCQTFFVEGFLVGAVFGGLAGLVTRRAFMSTALPAGFFIGINGAVGCKLIKRRDGTLYDTDVYDRAFGFAAGGFSMPIANSYYHLRSGQFIPVSIVLRRSLIASVLFGSLGVVLDRFNLFRPPPPDEQDWIQAKAAREELDKKTASL